MSRGGNCWGKRGRVRAAGKRQSLDELMHYLLTRREKATYARFRSKGFKIGSGRRSQVQIGIPAAQRGGDALDGTQRRGLAARVATPEQPMASLVSNQNQASRRLKDWQTRNASRSKWPFAKNCNTGVSSPKLTVNGWGQLFASGTTPWPKAGLLDGGRYGGAGFTLFLALFFLFIFWGKHRFTYFSLFCGFICATAVVVLWNRDRSAEEELSLTLPVFSAEGAQEIRLELHSEATGMMLGMHRVRDRMSGANTHWQAFAQCPVLSWSKQDATPGSPAVTPRFRDPTFEFLGFGIGHADLAPPDKPFARDRWGLYFPDWGATVILSAVPICWLLGRPARRRKYRRKQNLCEKCSYSLAGHAGTASFDADGLGTCPECGTKFRPVATIPPNPSESMKNES